MSEFLLDVFKGLCPIYLILLILGVVFRIREGNWTRFDSFLLLSFILFEFLAAFQPAFFYGTLSTSKRYLWIGLPLSFPFAAQGLLGLQQIPSFNKYFAILCIVLLGVNIFNTYSPIYHARHSRKKRAEWRVSRQAAAWISQDWKYGHTLPVAAFKCDQYQSGKRPLVKSELMRIGWLCGGQAYPIFFPSKNIPPDYIVSPTPIPLADYVLVKKIEHVCIYKNIQVGVQL